MTVRELIKRLEQMPPDAKIEGNDSWGCTAEEFDPILRDDGAVWVYAL
jgi:hypothetical protein